MVFKDMWPKLEKRIWKIGISMAQYCRHCKVFWVDAEDLVQDAKLGVAQLLKYTPEASIKLCYRAAYCDMLNKLEHYTKRKWTPPKELHALLFGKKKVIFQNDELTNYIKKHEA